MVLKIHLSDVQSAELSTEKVLSLKDNSQRRCISENGSHVAVFARVSDEASRTVGEISYTNIFEIITEIR